MTSGTLDRSTVVTASEVPVLFGCHPGGKTVNTLLAEKWGLKPVDVLGTEAMQLGHLVEQWLFERAATRWDMLPIRQKAVVDESLRIAATLDAQTVSGEPVEFKTHGLTGPVMAEWCGRVPPRSVFIQVQTQLLVTHAERAWVLALVGGRGLTEWQVMRDRELGEEIVRRVGEFLALLDSREWAPTEKSDVEYSDGVVELETDIVSRLANVRTAIKAYEEEARALEAVIYAYAGTAKHVKDKAGWLATVTKSTRRVWDSAALREYLGESLGKFESAIEVTSLRLREVDADEREAK